MRPVISIGAVIKSAQQRSPKERNLWDRSFVYLCIVTAFASVMILAFLLGSIFYQGLPQLSLRLLTNAVSSDPAKAGYQPALWGTIWICSICGVMSLPIGLATAILLEEFIPRHPILRFFHSLIRLNITNLAGVPSVVYGILGLTAFANAFGLFDNSRLEIGASHYDQFLTDDVRSLLVPKISSDAPDTKVTPETQFYDSNLNIVSVRIIPAGQPFPSDLKSGEYALWDDDEPGPLVLKRWYYLEFPFGKTVMTGGLTLMLVVLPIVIIASQEALRAVPSSLREAAHGLGATRWQVVWNVTLPAAIPGIMTGAILAMSRAVGEAAPILILGKIGIWDAPDSLLSAFTAMPLQIYFWTSDSHVEFHNLAASGIILLLAVLYCFNAIAVFIRYKMQRPLS